MRREISFTPFSDSNVNVIHTEALKIVSDQFSGYPVTQSGGHMQSTRSEQERLCVNKSPTAMRLQNLPLQRQRGKKA